MDSEAPQPEHDPEPQPDNLHIEVSDLPRPARRWFDRLSGHSRGDAGHAPWYQRQVRLSRVLGAATLALLLLLTLVVGTPIGAPLSALVSRPTSTSHVRAWSPTSALVTPTPSPYPTPTPIAPAIGAIPADCPQGAPLASFDPIVSPGIGGTDVWLVAGDFLGAQRPGSQQRATATIGQLTPGDYTSAGWPVQVMALVRANLTQPVTITGHDLRTGYPLWWSPDANNPGAVEEAAPVAVIDPTQLQSKLGDGQWDIWFGVLYLPGAGCYALQSSWAGGHWVAFVAAGR